MKWGQSIDELDVAERDSFKPMNLKPPYIRPCEKVYFRIPENHMVGDVEVGLLTYHFWQDKLIRIHFYANGSENARLLRKSIKTMFGEATSTFATPYFFESFWEGNTTKITSYYDRKESFEELTMESILLTAQQKRWLEEESQKPPSTTGW